jgi:hypothetical protein
MRAIGTAAAGLQAYADSIDRIAQRRATEGAGDGLIADSVQLAVDRVGFEASLKVLRAADEMAGHLIHIIA